MKNKILTATATIILLMSLSAVTYAGEFTQKKNETIYVNLDEFGSVEQINVYNEYLLNKQEQVIDYAQYESIQNINTKLSPLQNDSGTIWETKDLDRLAYIGKISNEYSKNIPWIVDLSYKLNGVECNPQDIVGKDGIVSVTISVLPNKNANTYYQNNYMLQINSTFDMTDYISVEAKDATEVMTGMTKTLMFIALPGQEKTFDITIGSDKFEMSGFTFAMIPLQGDIFDAIVDVVKDKSETEDAFDSLDKSLNIILSEMNGMTTGLTNMIEGTKNLNSGTDKIYELSGDRNESIELLKQDLTQLSNLSKNTVTDIDNLKKHVNNINEMLEVMNKTNEELLKNLINVEKDLDELADRLENLPGDLKQLKNLLSDSINMLEATERMLEAQLAGNSFDASDIIDNLEKIGEKTEAIATIAGTNAAEAEAQGDMATAGIYNGILVQTQSIGTSLNAIKLELQDLQQVMNNGTSAGTEMIDSIDDIQSDLKKIVNINSRLIEYSKDVPGYVYNLEDTIDNMVTHIETINKYSNMYLEDKEDVINALTNIQELLVELQEIEKTANRLVGNIQSNLEVVDNEIYRGTTYLTNGMESVLDNTKNITKQSNNLRTSKDAIKNILKNRNQELENETTVFNIDPNEKVVSFTNEKNDSPEKVQILLKTKDIKQDSFDNIIDMENKEENISIWERITNIFKTIWNAIISIFI